MTVVGTPAAGAPSKATHIALWVVQVLLAVAFGMAGTMKTFTPIDELVKSMPWFTSVPFLPRLIGPAELAGALGMILPSVTRIRPVLTPLAGVGFSIIMILAGDARRSRRTPNGAHQRPPRRARCLRCVGALQEGAHRAAPMRIKTSSARTGVRP